MVARNLPPVLKMPTHTAQLHIDTSDCY